ncbi:MAG: FtsW/RodA/SpoVE family cell cycle protein [Propionibacteriaceae bacterium]|jgi:cell division protein FtsW (lipid II flippase)|nr:FtsW/RodA/SpoVE family cell cycle protein [Propionibacteriaceae bacterium]
MVAETMAARSSPAPAFGYRKRRTIELFLLLIGQSIGWAGYMLTTLDQTNTPPPGWETVTGVWFAAGIVIHLVVRFRLPYADPIIVPIAFALTGLGLAQIHRIDLIEPVTTAAHTQALAVAIGLVCFIVVAFVIREPRRLRAYPFILSAIGIALLLMPLLPGIGVEANGSRIWIDIAGFSFQPAEIAKIILAASFAGYLAEHRDVLSVAGKNFLGLNLPRARDLGPIAVMWGVSLAILVFQNDLGTSLMFFGLFVMMIYVATGKGSWVLLGGVLFAGAAVAAYHFAGHARRRFDFWLHPFDYPDDATQIIGAQFGLSHGGLFGSGWGLGRPDLTIFASTDMIAAALGEEMGVIGLMGIIVLYALFVFRGLRTALGSRDPFLTLFAGGLSFVFAIQVFAIIGGVTRLLPLTGLTTPFLSQGGSSMIANWILVGVLAVVSHQARRPHAAAGETTDEGVTDFEDDMTQVIPEKQLRRIGIGATQPVAAFDADQVPVAAAGESGPLRSAQGGAGSANGPSRSLGGASSVASPARSVSSPSFSPVSASSPSLGPSFSGEEPTQVVDGRWVPDPPQRGGADD